MKLDLLEFFNLNFNMLLILFPLLMILYIGILAELNRTPFDFSEGEYELISGYNIEYLSSGFALIFLAEYSNIIFLMMIMSIFFMCKFYFLIWMLFLYMVILIRTTLPRLCYDKLMMLVWMNYLPIVFNYMMFIVMLKYFLF